MFSSVLCAWNDECCHSDHSIWHVLKHSTNPAAAADQLQAGIKKGLIR